MVEQGVCRKGNTQRPKLIYHFLLLLVMGGDIMSPPFFYLPINFIVLIFNELYNIYIYFKNIFGI